MPPRQKKPPPRLKHLLNPNPLLNHPFGQDEALLNSNQRLDHLGHLHSKLLRQLAQRALDKKNEALLLFLIDQALKVLEPQSTSSLGTIPEASIDAAPEVLPTRRRERGGPPEPPTPARILVQRLAANRSPVASPGIHYAGSDDDDDNDDNNNDSQSDNPLFNPLARRFTMRPLPLYSDEDDPTSPAEPSAPHSEQSAPSRASGRQRRVIVDPAPPSPSPPARQPHHGGQQ
ncbi:hypothetical protein R3P38DRAFT_2803800 [Favolaschia claudopus]|uniref:Uncharacterized protein n=1 Tax=Favolaschia claudopus TaxID=2862362 RepID=A0AAV9ZSK7_9AGAR